MGVFFRPLVFLYVSAFLSIGRLRLDFSFVRWLPVSLVWWWVALGFCPSVAYLSCGGECLPSTLTLALHRLQHCRRHVSSRLHSKELSFEISKQLETFTEQKHLPA